MDVEILKEANAITNELAIVENFLRTMKNIEVNSPSAQPNISVYSHLVPVGVDRWQIYCIIKKAVEMEKVRLQHKLLLL